MKENTRKYLVYAFGEILLVMIGILLALQVNNWNQDRQNRLREQVILQDLHEEFLNNQEQLEFITNGHLTAFQSISWLLDRHGHYQEAPSDSLIYHLRRSLSAYTFNPSQSAIQALINTSSFELIQNRELRKRLLMWTDQYRDFAEDEEAARASFFNEFIPFLNEYGDIETFASDNTMNSLSLSQKQSYNSRRYKNQFYTRKLYLAAIIFSGDNELGIMKDNMNAIIELTASSK